MKIKLLEPHFTVCKVSELCAGDWNAPFCFIGITDEERSLVCPENMVPAETIAREDGWRAMRIEGVLDFGLVGILARIAGILAEQDIPIFAISTFNTDYLLLKEEKLAKAMTALRMNGYEIE